MNFIFNIYFTFFFFILINIILFFTFLIIYLFFFWISIDTFDYYLSFLTWLVSIFFSFLFNLVYSYFFFNNFSNNTKIDKNIFNNTLFNKFPINSSFNSKDLYVSKHDLNWFLYSWLINPNSIKNNIILENLFDFRLNKNWWNVYYDFFIKLYKLSYLLKNASKDSSFFFLNNKLNNFSNNAYKGDYLNTLNYFINNSFLNNYSSLITYYIINNYNNYFNELTNKNSSLIFLKNKYEWNLYNFNNELALYPFLLKNRTGMFFLDNFNYEKFSYFIFNFNELWSLNFFFKNQLNSSKWNRWLYRYSILHRKLLKFSHKITLSKRLINSGFYDSKIFDKNIWANEYLNKINSNASFSSFFFNYYSTLDSTINASTSSYNLNLTNNESSKNTLNLLNFYENSYFWYLKRFYLFNSLSTNFIKSKINVKQDINNYSSLNQHQNSTFIKYSTLLSHLLHSNFNNLNLYSHSNNYYFNLLNYKNNSNIGYNFFKDIYLLSNDNDLLTKDNLNLFYWITLNISKQNDLLFFNYLNNLYLTSYNICDFYFVSNNQKNLNTLNFWLIYSLINTDEPYLNDITYFSLFN